MKKGKRMGRKFALDEKAIGQIKKRLAAGETLSALAREFGVARTSIRRYGRSK
jgi:DNA invertase Pin-like site-specific DNA recombinase